MVAVLAGLAILGSSAKNVLNQKIHLDGYGFSFTLY
jgi:hypothetical protein